MVKKSKLLAALDAEKGRDYEAEKKKKQVKAAEKRKRQKMEADEELSSDDDAEEKTPEINGKMSKRVKIAATKPDVAPASIPLPRSSDADSDEESASQSEQENIHAENGTTIPQPLENADASASEADPESDVPLSDLDEEDMEDTIPHQRLTINNGPALLASKKRVTVAKAKMPFHYHNSLVSKLPPSSDVISDPNDDLTRELEFYRIARDAAVTARSNLKSEKVPFTRPTDYFAEMVKSDDHMGKVKKKMYDEAAGKKAGEEARKLRDAKKFGKAVQVAKEQERAKEKRTTLDKIKELKKKRKGQIPATTTEADDMFQEIAVDNNKNSNDASGSKKRPYGGGEGGTNFKRQKKDSKFGYGGKKRFSKSGDTMSSADLSGFSAKGMKGKGTKGKRPTTRRLGKSKRTAGRA